MICGVFAVLCSWLATPFYSLMQSCWKEHNGPFFSGHRCGVIPHMTPVLSFDALLQGRYQVKGFGLCLTAGTAQAWNTGRGNETPGIRKHVHYYELASRSDLLRPLSVNSSRIAVPGCITHV